MKGFTTSSLIVLFFVFSLISCNVETKDQVEYRNQNFIWFVPEGETMGRWVKIDVANTAEILTSGHCTEFYYNGNERLTYNLDQRGKKDSTFYFDLNNTITHYSTGNDENITNYFYVNGKFESFLWDGSMAMSGIVEENELTKFKWEGKMADFYTLISTQTHVWRGFEEFLKKIATAIQKREQSGVKYIPEDQLNTLDSVRLNLIDSTAYRLEILSNFEVAQECISIQKSSIQFVGTTQSMLEEDCEKILQRMQLEFNTENVNSLAPLIKGMLEKSEQADRNDEEIYTEWARLFQLGDYIVPYLANLDKK